MSLCCECESYSEAKEKDCYHNPSCGLFEIRRKCNPRDDPVLREIARQGSRCENCS